MALAELRAAAADEALTGPYSAPASPKSSNFACILADLKNVLNIFGGSDIDEDQQNELYKEVLLMTLARAADADINIQTAEVDRIREIIKDHTGVDVSATDVRVAARAELYAESSLRNAEAVRAMGMTLGEWLARSFDLPYSVRGARGSVS